MGRSRGWALGVLLFAMAAGCSYRARDGESGPDERGVRAAGEERPALTREQRSAVRSIASARCEREERCGNIGVDQKFADKNACLERVRADWSEELNARECPAGVRERELDECIEDIRGEDCGSPFDSLQRMLSCGTAEICSG